MDGAEKPDFVGLVQAVVLEAAGASLEPLRGSTLHQKEGVAPEVGQAFAWAAGACWVKEAVLGVGDVVGALHLGASVA